LFPIPVGLFALIFIKCLKNVKKSLTVHHLNGPPVTLFEAWMYDF
jgi:hypothetical protein